MPDKITKFLNSLDSNLKQRIKLKLAHIKTNPFLHNDVKKLKGYKDLFRVRIGEIRIIFRLKNKNIEIIDIDFRGNIY